MIFGALWANTNNSESKELCPVICMRNQEQRSAVRDGGIPYSVVLYRIESYLLGARNVKVSEGLPSYLIPGPLSQHGGEERVHVAGMHGLRVPLDALLIRKNQRLPQLGVAVSELIVYLPAVHSVLIRNSKYCLGFESLHLH